MVVRTCVLGSFLCGESPILEVHLCQSYLNGEKEGQVVFIVVELCSHVLEKKSRSDCYQKRRRRRVEVIFRRPNIFTMFFTFIIYCAF